MDYQEFLQKKIKKHVLSGFDIDEGYCISTTRSL